MHRISSTVADNVLKEVTHRIQVDDQQPVVSSTWLRYSPVGEVANQPQYLQRGGALTVRSPPYITNTQRAGTQPVLMSYLRIVGQHMLQRRAGVISLQTQQILL